MKEKGLVTVKIYDVAGRLVRTLVNEVKDAGAYSAVWDGRNNGGVGVASGIYFYKMETCGLQRDEEARDDQIDERRAGGATRREISIWPGA